MRYLQNTTACSVLALLVGMGPALAQSTAPEAATAAGARRSAPAALELGQIEIPLATIVVDGEDRNGGGTAGQAISQDKVTAETIYTTNRNTLDDALAIVPGVYVEGFGGSRNEKIAFVRGFDLFQVPLSIDGIRVYLPYDNRLDLGRFITPDLAEIQVQKGYVSVLNGPGGMGGAINLVTRKPTREFEGEVRTGIDLGNTGDLAGRTGFLSLGSRQDQIYVQGNAAYHGTDGFFLPRDYDAVPVGTGVVEDGGRRDFAEAEDWRVNLKAGYTPNDTDEYVLSFTRQEGEKQAPYNVFEPVRGITNQPPGTSYQRNWRWPKWDVQNIYFLSHTEVGETAYIDTKVFYNTLDNHLAAFDDSTFTTRTTGRSFDSYYDETSYGGSVEAGIDLHPRDTLKGAVHFRRDNHEKRNINQPGLATAAFDPLTEQEEDTWSFALENTFRATDRLDLVAGISYDYRDLTRAEDYEDGIVSEYPYTSDGAFSWQAAAIYRLSDTGEVHASVSDRTRFPTLWERFSTRFGEALPNSNLEAERATNYEIGWSDTVYEGVKLGATVFYSDVRNVIQGVNVTVIDPNDPDGEQQFAQNQNVGDGAYKGIELKAEWQARDNLTFGGHYVLLDREINSPEFPNIEAVGTPRHSGFLYARWEAFDSFTLVPSVEMYSSRFSSDRFERLFYETGGYALANFSAEYRVNDNFTAGAGVRNILDHEYSVQYGFPEAGRNFFLNARLTF
ncbi:TonB-dependent receptor plug domain-containing protein [Terrihabitans sp. B22-R8]|uniref:TonB-dependent receptor plug domain-containing protein n=1 Tax=Terrihabitans sp. B22-R8 TaxID=3425128 RepID=UPI00403D4806